MLTYILSRTAVLSSREVRSIIQLNEVRTMQVPQDIRWDVTPTEAIEIQREMAARVVAQDQGGEIHYVAGVDVGFEGEDNRTARAAVVVLGFPDLEPMDYAIA